MSTEGFAVTDTAQTRSTTTCAMSLDEHPSRTNKQLMRVFSLIFYKKRYN